MFLTELFEQQTTKHAAFCFGRMNPPTVGHGQLINVVANASQGGDYFIFVSQTQDAKKNPLSYETKVKFIKALFPEQASHVVYSPELKTIMQVAEWLYNAGYRAVTFAAGSDRLDSFKKLLTDYNGKEGGNVYYKFDSINFVSSGDRDPDADGVAGVSASSAREAASQGNLEAFAQATGAGKLAKPLYLAVRKGMLLENVTGKLPPDETMNIDGADLERLRKLPQYKQGYDAQMRMSTGTPNNPHELGSDQYNAFYIGTSDAFVKKNSFIDDIAEGWKDAAIGAAMLGIGGGAMYAQPQPYVEIDGVNWRLTSRTPGILAHSKVVTAADGKKYQIWRGPKNRHLAHPIDDKQVDEGASGYIPKNKKEAKDPRWSNALTVDVKPNTPTKNMKALGLI
jgi:hypothetical protein